MTFDAGNPVLNDNDPRGTLIEDEDGAPLAHELQRGGRIWTAIYDALPEEVVTRKRGAEAADDLVRALDPILWPLLPSNDNNDAVTAIRALPRRSGTPEWDSGVAVAQAAGYDMGLAVATDAVSSLA